MFTNNFESKKKQVIFISSKGHSNHFASLKPGLQISFFVTGE